MLLLARRLLHFCSARWKRWKYANACSHTNGEMKINKTKEEKIICFSHPVCNFLNGANGGAIKKVLTREFMRTRYHKDRNLLRRSENCKANLWFRSSDINSESHCLHVLKVFLGVFVF